MEGTFYPKPWWGPSEWQAVLIEQKQKIHNAQSGPLPLLSSMNVTNITLGMNPHLHSETLENMHPSYDKPTHNSCYQEPHKPCQTTSPIKKNEISEGKHDGFGTLSLFWHGTLENITSLPSHPNISKQEEISPSQHPSTSMLSHGFWVLTP